MIGQSDIHHFIYFINSQEYLYSLFKDLTWLIFWQVLCYNPPHYILIYNYTHNSMHLLAMLDPD